MKILTNHRFALTTGIILALVLAFILDQTMNDPQYRNVYNVLSFARWVHVGAGIFWIGLLYYFNAVQVPAMADAAADKGGPGGAGISKYVAPRALFWFRWSALATWVAGAWLLGANFLNAFTFGLASQVNVHWVTIGIGVWLGTIMLINVWGVIWPNQKKILGFKPATDDEKAKARKAALYASRINFILSVPMLICMISAGHGLPY